MTPHPEMSATTLEPVETLARRMLRGADVVTTVVLLVLVAVEAIALAFWAVIWQMGTMTCATVPSVYACDYGLVYSGHLLANGLPWFILGAAVLTTVLLWKRRRLAFWVPLIAAPVAALSWYVSGLVVLAGVSS